jgi:hypothetical protein
MAKLTKHAIARLRQRGYRESDLELVIRFGTEVADGVTLRRRDADRRIGEIKRQLSDLERLKGTHVVLQDDVVVTTYRVSKHNRRKLFRTQP